MHRSCLNLCLCVREMHVFLLLLEMPSVSFSQVQDMFLMLEAQAVAPQAVLLLLPLLPETLLWDMLRLPQCFRMCLHISKHHVWMWMCLPQVLLLRLWLRQPVHGHDTRREGILGRTC